MEQYFGDGDYWCIRFISKGFEFTEGDLTAVSRAVGSGYRSQWNRADGRNRTNRLAVWCTKGQRPGPTVTALRVLQQRYPSARLTMNDRFFREDLNKLGFGVVVP